MTLSIATWIPPPLRLGGRGLAVLFTSALKTEQERKRKKLPIKLLPADSKACLHIFPLVLHSYTDHFPDSLQCFNSGWNNKTAPVLAASCCLALNVRNKVVSFYACHNPNRKKPKADTVESMKKNLWPPF